MTEQHERPSYTTPEDAALIDGARRLYAKISAIPGAKAVLIAAALLILFLLSAGAGQVVGEVFDGDGRSAAIFGVIFATVLGSIIGVGVWLDRRKRTRDSQTGQAEDDPSQH